jgi:hypothetical protein
MESLQLTPAELELIQLKREKELNEAREKQLQEEIKYQERLAHYRKSIQVAITRIESNNSLTRRLFQTLTELGVGEHIFLKEKDCNVGYIVGSPYFEIKEQDSIEIPSIKELYISSQWGDFSTKETDLSCEIPYKLSSRYQAYKPQGIAKKIKEAIQKEVNEQSTQNKIDQVKNDLTLEFTQKYPECVITSGVKTNYPKYRGESMSYTNFLHIVFPNSSWVKISFSTNGSWFVMEKHDHKLVSRTKEEYLDYLAS